MNSGAEPTKKNAGGEPPLQMRNAECEMRAGSARCQLLKPAMGEIRALPQFASECECGMKCQVINFPNVIIWRAVPAANS